MRSANSRNVQRACPSSGGLQARAISRASASPSSLRKIKPRRRTGAQGGFQSLFDKALANSLDGRHAHPHRLGNLLVDLARPSLSTIGMKQDPSMGEPPSRALTARNQLLQLPAFVSLQRYLVAFGQHRRLRQFHPPLPRQQEIPSNLSGNRLLTVI